VPYVRGLARYRDLLRGGVAGDRVGLLKLLVDPVSRGVLGAHVLGTSATEVVHVAQTVMAADLPVDHLAGAPFVAATVADAYRLAADDAVARLGREPAPGRAPAAAGPNGCYGLATFVTAKEASR
jgi:NAD(P) transhydrogenase